MMIGSKIAFWMHLGCLGGHLGAQKMGVSFPTCEQPSEPTPILSKVGENIDKIEVTMVF